MKLTVRKLKTPEEFLERKKISSLAFDWTGDMEELRAEMEKQLREDAEGTHEYTSRGDMFTRSNAYGAFDESGRLTSSMEIPRYPVRYDGSVVTMAGIGGVMTKPECRRSGGIREIFKTVLRAEYAEGAVFSSLYPFNVRYYSQYGYAAAIDFVSYKIPMKELYARRFTGGADMLEPGADISDVRKIYDAFADGRNMMCAREDIDWKGWSDWYIKPYSDKRYVYVYKNGEGQPVCYIAFSPSDDGGKRVMRVDEAAYTNIGALAETLAFFGAIFTANYDVVDIRLPVSEPLDLVIRENNIDEKRYFKGMHRVINVAEVLRLTRYTGSGEINIRVNDEYIPENNGVWHVLVENNRAVNVVRLDTAPDIVLDVGSFTRFILGTNDYRELFDSGLYDVRCTREKLRLAFHRKKCSLYEGF